MSPGILAAVTAAVLVAALAQAVTGFGFALLAVPTMALFLDTRDAVVISALLGTFTSGVQAWTDRGDVDADMARRLLVASALGMPVGLVVFVAAPESALRAVLGIFVLGATWMLWRGVPVPVGPRMDWVMGAASGALNTSLSTNGPPVVFLLQARGLAPERFRATLYRVFAVMGVVTVVMFAVAGRIDHPALSGSAVAVPASLVGLNAGWRLRTRISTERFKSVVLALLCASGVSALVAALR